MGKIDLRELLARESERVEWKRAVADVDDVVRTAVAFANDFSNLGGGYIVCGAEETKDAAGFPKVDLVGLDSSRFKELEGRILDHCRTKVNPPLIPVVEEIPVPGIGDRRALVFIVPSTGAAHSYRSGGMDSERYYIRDSKSVQEVKNGLLRELLERKGALEPWDRRVNESAGLGDIDLLMLREYLRQMSAIEPNKPLEDYLSPNERLSAFVPPLTGRSRAVDEIKPRNFTLLLFSDTPTKFYPGAFSVFSIYRGHDRGEQVAERHEVLGSLVEQARRLIALLNTEAYVAFDKTDARPNQAKYPQRALQEAVVNALVHRTYESDQPTRITVFSDRIEIFSPGGLPKAVVPALFVAGRASPFWRNQSLAWFFSRLQLAQSEGQGIPTILRTMREEGCPAPTFELGGESVVCVMPAHPRHELVKQLAEIENSIILGNHELAGAKLRSLLEKDPYDFRSLSLYCEVNNALGTPRRVYDFWVGRHLDDSLVNPSACLILAAALSRIQDLPEAKALAARLLARGRHGRLEANEVRNVALSYRKVGDDEEALRFLEEQFQKNRHLLDDPFLLGICAKAKMDLAKRCMDTGRDNHLSVDFRRKAWERCRGYLDDAERDLDRALSHAANSPEKEYLLRDLDFLQTMRRIAQRPGSSRQGRARRG